MPIYEYECCGCRHRFELLVLAGTVPACPECQGQGLERVVSLFAVSSDGSREIALADGRKRSASVRRDKAHAQHEYEKGHSH